MKNYIRLFKPAVDQAELKEINKVVKRSWLGFGPLVYKFEKEWGKYIGAKYSVGVNSCTAALHLALAVNNFKKNKKVLVPSITFSATAASALYCNLIPVFVDVEPNTYIVNVNEIEQSITNNTSALMIPSLLGNIPDLVRLHKLLILGESAKLVFLYGLLLAFL